jgi:hypothetical protein
MSEDVAESLAREALWKVRFRMEFSDCYEEGVRNVAMAIKDAADKAEAAALSFKSVDTNQVSFGEMF